MLLILIKDLKNAEILNESKSNITTYDIIIIMLHHKIMKNLKHNFIWNYITHLLHDLKMS